jgi:hypothetical protein
MAPIDGQKSPRDQINETYIWHKRIADERNILVVTASQGTREALERPRFSLRDFAEDIRKVANCDMAFGLCQSRQQNEDSVGRFVLMASRDTEMVGVESVFGMALDIGQFIVWEANPADYVAEDD